MEHANKNKFILCRSPSRIYDYQKYCHPIRIVIVADTFVTSKHIYFFTIVLWIKNLKFGCKEYFSELTRQWGSSEYTMYENKTTIRRWLFFCAGYITIEQKEIFVAIICKIYVQNVLNTRRPQTCSKLEKNKEFHANCRWLNHKSINN